MTAEEGLSDELKGGDPLLRRTAPRTSRFPRHDGRASDREDDAGNFDSTNALAEERGSEPEAEDGREDEHERQATDVARLGAFGQRVEKALGNVPGTEDVRFDMDAVARSADCLALCLIELAAVGQYRYTAFPSHCASTTAATNPRN